MDKSKLINSLATRTKLSKATSGRSLDALVDIALSAASAGHEVGLAGLPLPVPSNAVSWSSSEAASKPTSRRRKPG